MGKNLKYTSNYHNIIVVVMHVYIVLCKVYTYVHMHNTCIYILKVVGK